MGRDAFLISVWQPRRSLASTPWSGGFLVVVFLVVFLVLVGCSQPAHPLSNDGWTIRCHLEDGHSMVPFGRWPYRRDHQAVLVHYAVRAVPR